MINQTVQSDVPVNVLDNNQLLDWMKKRDIYPFQFMEAYHAVKEKTMARIEEYLIEKGLIQTVN